MNCISTCLKCADQVILYVKYKELRLQHSVYGKIPFLFDLVPLSHKQVWWSLLFQSQQNTLFSREYQGR